MKTCRECKRPINDNRYYIVEKKNKKEYAHEGCFLMGIKDLTEFKEEFYKEEENGNS